MTEREPQRVATAGSEQRSETLGGHLCRLHDPELWHAPDLSEQARAICTQCPAIRSCAARALQISAAYRLSGLWAGVDIPETTTRSAYRNRLNRLRHVAATGTQLPARRRLRRVAV